MEGRVDEKEDFINTSHRRIRSKSWDDWIDRGHDGGQLSDPEIGEKAKTRTADSLYQTGHEVYLGKPWHVGMWLSG